MKLLVLTPDYPPDVWSGIGSAVAHQTRALAGLGHEVDVGVVGPRRASVAALPGRLRVRSLDSARFPFDARNFDLIHLHSLALAGLALEMRRRYRLPLVYTAHSLVEHELEDPVVREWTAIQHRLLRESDRVLFPSRAEREAAAEIEPRLGERSRVLANGVRATPATEPSARPGDPGGPVVFAGRFAASKGIDLLAATAERLLSEERPPTFVLAGGHGDRACHDHLEHLAALHPRRFSLVGWLRAAALEKLLARAGVVVMPSRYEPFGMVAVEAMRLGTPVLGAAVGGLRDVLGRGAGGRLIATREPTAWAAAIRRLSGDEAGWRELARLGPGWVRRHFDREALARVLADRVYRPLVGAGSTWAG